MYELKNEYYHHTGYFIIIIFIEFIATFALAVFLTLKFPLNSIPYIGAWSELVLNQIQFSDLSTKIFITVSLNIGIYWFLLILPICSCTDFFFKHLVGYKLSLLDSIKITCKRIFILIAKNGAMLSLTALVAVVCYPLWETYLNILGANVTDFFRAISSIAYVAACYSLIRILLDALIPKLFKGVNSNELHQR